MQAVELAGEVVATGVAALDNLPDLGPGRAVVQFFVIRKAVVFVPGDPPFCVDGPAGGAVAEDVSAHNGQMYGRNDNPLVFKGLSFRTDFGLEIRIRYMRKKPTEC